MADPFPVGSTPGQYATYPGRVVPGSIPDRVAPDLEPSYYKLAPDPDVFYGTFFPAAFNRPGSARWMREGTNFRWTLPSVVREGLLGWLDMANDMHTGEVTPRAAEGVMTGLATGGMALGEKGALGAAGTKVPGFRMLPGAEEQAREMGFFRVPLVYHGTNKIVTPGFSLTPPSRTMTGPTSELGIWAAENPQVAPEYADIAARLAGPREGFGQNIVPLLARSDRRGTVPLTADMTEREVAGALLDAWDNGYDAIRLLNYTTPGGTPGQSTWLFKDPSQLRVPWARFDPARRDSNDLLAGSAAPIPVTAPGFRPQNSQQDAAPSPVPPAIPGFRPQNLQPDAAPLDGYPRPYHRQPPPQRTGPPNLAESLAYWRLMNEPKVY